MATVFCPNCGSEVRGKFCTNCGASVEAAPDQTAAGSDSGATTVIRSEDLLRKAQEELSGNPNPAADPTAGASAASWQQPNVGQGSGWSQPDPAAPQAGGWTQQDPTASPQGGWTGQDPTAPQGGGWTGQNPANASWQSGDQSQPGGWQSPTPEGSQGWQSSTPQSGGGWQQPPPQEPPPSSGWSAPGGSTPGQSGPGYYAQQLGIPSGGTGFATGAATAPSMEIGALVRGAWDIMNSRIAEIAPIAGVYAVIFAIAQLVGKLGLGLSLVSLLITLVGYAVIEAGTVLITQAAVNGQPAAFGDLLPRIQAALPKLIPAVIVAYIAIAIGFIFIIVPGLFLFTIWLFIPQSIMLDDAATFGSFGESWNLVKGNFFGILGRWLVAVLVLIIPAIVVGIITALLGRIPIVGYLVGGFLGGLLLAYFMAYTTQMFLALRGASTAVPAGVSSSYTGV